MTRLDPLDLHDIAALLGVTFWRVRKWRQTQIRGGAGRCLPVPDVSDKAGKPLWSEPVIIDWATPLGLWPPKNDQHVCPECGNTYSIYGDDGPIRPHGWTQLDDGEWELCPGSGMPPAGTARELAKAGGG